MDYNVSQGKRQKELQARLDAISQRAMQRVQETLDGYGDIVSGTDIHVKPLTVHFETKSHKKENLPKASDLEAQITTILHEIGIPSHTLGYLYMREAIMMAVEDMTILQDMTHKVYHPIAKNYQKTPMSVVRGIGYAIEAAENRGSAKVVGQMFKKNKPANKEFISFIADRLRLGLESHI